MRGLMGLGMCLVWCGCDGEYMCGRGVWGKEGFGLRGEGRIDGCRVRM